MKTFKKLLFLLAIAGGTKTYADVGDVAKKIANISAKVDDICKRLSISPEKKATCAKATKLGGNVAGIIDNVETFRTRSLNIVSNKGDKLNSLLNCMGSTPSESCKALKCSNENECIAMILKTTSELLQPIVNDLIASKIKGYDTDGKAIEGTSYANGALFRLASLSIIPAKLEPKFAEFRTKIASFADNIIAATAMLDVIAMMLSSSVFTESTDATPAQRQAALQVAAEIKPLELPKGTIINPETGLDEPVEETF